MGNLPLPVSHLCHVTHREQEEQIKKNDPVFCFKAKRKVGKSLNETDLEKGCYRGESYHSKQGKLEIPDEDTLYDRIPAGEEIFPDFYSWWGLYVTNPPRGDQQTLPNYLKNPPDSIYGTRAFVIHFHDILKSYASARECSPHEICLRVGGTMRYKHEIAYVIIVCTSNDEALIRYKPIPMDDELIDMKGLVDEKGIITNYVCVPSFNTKYYNKALSYETLSFALYFPEQYDFRCYSNVIRVEDVEHTGCIRRSRLRRWYDQNTRTFEYRMKCPDEVTPYHLQTHTNVTDFARNVAYPY